MGEKLCDDLVINADRKIQSYTALQIVCPDKTGFRKSSTKRNGVPTGRDVRTKRFVCAIGIPLGQTFSIPVYVTTGNREQLIFSPSKAKSIIDDIDKLLAKNYGFSEEELDFIINYDIKYRMGKALFNNGG